MDWMAGFMARMETVEGPSPLWTTLEMNLPANGLTLVAAIFDSIQTDSSLKRSKARRNMAATAMTGATGLGTTIPHGCGIITSPSDTWREMSNSPSTAPAKL